MARNWGFSPVKDPAFFASYNSVDWKRAAAVAKELYDKGYPVWYDAGLEAGTKKWNAQISSNIEQSYALIIFITKGLFERKESYVTIEYEEAKALGKVIIPVFLDDIELKDVDPQYRSYLIEWRKLHGVNGVGKDTKEIAEQLVSVIEEDERIEYIKISDANVLSAKNQILWQSIRRRIITETVVIALCVLTFIFLFLCSSTSYAGFYLNTGLFCIPAIIVFMIALVKNIVILRKGKCDFRIMYIRNNQIHYLFKSNRTFASFPNLLILLYQWYFILEWPFYYRFDGNIDGLESILTKLTGYLLLFCLLYSAIYRLIWKKCRFTEQMSKCVKICGCLSGFYILSTELFGLYRLIHEIGKYLYTATDYVPFVISTIFCILYPLLYVSQVGIISDIRKFD